MTKKDFVVGGLAALAVAAVGVRLLAPVMVSAEDEPEDEVDTSVVTVEVTILDTIVISTADDLLVQLEPDPITGEEDSGTVRYRVATNNPSGYYVELIENEDTDQAAELRQDGWTAGDTVILPGGGSILSPLALDDNEWGFRIASMGAGYAKVPAWGGGAVEIARKLTASAVGGDPVNVTFGAKVNEELEPGVYSNEVLITAITNP